MSNDVALPRLLKVDEAARYLDCSRATVYARAAGLDTSDLERQAREGGEGTVVCLS